jgi:ribA/ribD-fused uncharacterized protein
MKYSKNVVDMEQNQEVIYFWRETESDYGCFSNWYPSPFTEDGKLFPTSEHYLMYHKALLMGDVIIAEAILNAVTPKRVKDLGRKVANWDENKWVKNRKKIMYNGILAKCNAHKSIKNCLLATQNKVIAEASPYDKIWGIGLTKFQALGNKPWEGLNLLGEVLMKVRKHYQVPTTTTN